MIKLDIVNAIVNKTNITRTKAEQAVETVFEAMKNALGRGERIELRRFGVFNVKPRKTGIGRNPRTGQQVSIPPGKAVRFKPGKELQSLPATAGLPSPNAWRPRRRASAEPVFSRRAHPTFMGNSTGNGHGRVPLRNSRPQLPANYRFAAAHAARAAAPALARHRFLLFDSPDFDARGGIGFATSFAQNEEPFSGNENPFAMPLAPFEHPRLLLLGIPFSLTLLGFFMAHEMGHFLACKYYGIDCSYPFFLPSPFPVRHVWRSDQNSRANHYAPRAV